MSDTLEVVVVDDSRVVISHLTRLIDELDGVTIVGTAQNGAEAVRVVNEVSPDLVLMDIVMPGMDGLTALRAIRAQHAEMRVVMLSSVGGSHTRAEEAFRLGAIQVLGKPFNALQLDTLFKSERAVKMEQG